MNTTVSVADRSTIVLGGLIAETDQVTDTGIPIIMDLPVLGNLAKTSVKTKGRSELMIFIQPIVVHDNSEAVTKSYDEDVRSEVGEDVVRTFPEPGVPTIQQREVIVEDVMIEDQPLKRLGQRLFGKKKKEREPLPAASAVRLPE